MRLPEIEGRGIAAEQGRQFVVKNLNDLLTGRDAAQNGFAERFDSDARDEFFRDLEIDIGLEEREPDLPQRGIDVCFADFPVTAEVLKDLLQFIAELRKYGNDRAKSSALFLRRRARRRLYSRSAFF